MLSSAKIGRSSWRYYQRTVAGGACEYYTEDGDRPGRWHGQGLGELGLTPGALVAERELEAMFGRGLSPTTGRALGQGWRVDAVTGYDLTFSAPKSVSALWALGDPATVEAVDAAHTAAVHAALGFLDSRASVSRRGKDGVDQIASAGLAAALFDHRTSRTGDPQLHTHALVINKALCVDGAWRTLDGYEIYHHKKAAGAIYQTALRAELTARMPVSFGRVSEHGQAEIAGTPDTLLAVWSTRTAAVMGDAVPTIADAEQALGRPVSAGERARIIKTAVLTTRPAKELDVPEGDLRARWAGQAAGLGWDGPRLRLALQWERQASERVNPVNPGWADQVAAEAVTAVGRCKAVWSRADLTVQVAARIPTNPGARLRADGVVGLVEQLTDAALAGTVHGAVGLGPDQVGVTARVSDDRYASAELVDTEARILERVITGGFNTPARVPAHAVGWFFDGPSAALSGEQRRAAVKLVASKDLVTVMTAPAGAGKTTTLAAAVRVWWRLNTEVIMLAPSARAAAELATATGAPGHTVARWLLTQQHLDDQPTGHRAEGRLGHWSVVVLDEASMLTTTDLDQLSARVARAGASLVLVGDPGQIGAVNGPGGMFEHLTHVLGPRTVELTELHRFIYPWEAAATLRLRDGDPTVLTDYADHDRIHPEATAQDAADAVFQRWHAAVEQGRDALMLARSWTDVTDLNARARAAAIATGAVTGPVLATVTTKTASTRGHTEQRSWRAGDVLIAKKNTTRIRIGDDTVRNGDRYRVIAADPGETEGGLVVQDLRGRGTTTLPAGYLARHTEYGWAATIDGAQGATADIGIVLARSGLDREHLYVAMSRGREANHVHTTPELNTGDAGPHRPTQARAQARAQAPDRPAQAAVQAPGRGQHPAASPHWAEAGQLVLPDLDAAITQLTTALSTSGRERAAHSLLDPPIAQARERDWERRDDQRPPQPVPAKHVRNQRDLDRARARLEQAHDHVDRLDAQVRDLQDQLIDAPRWARGRRTALTRTLTFTTETVLPSATRELHQASGDVDALTHYVEADTKERLDNHAVDRYRRRQAWARQTDRPYTDPNTVVGPADPPRPSGYRQRANSREPYRALPPTRGPVRSM